MLQVAQALTNIFSTCSSRSIFNHAFKVFVMLWLHLLYLLLKLSCQPLLMALIINLQYTVLRRWRLDHIARCECNLCLECVWTNSLHKRRQYWFVWTHCLTSICCGCVMTWAKAEASRFLSLSYGIQATTDVIWLIFKWKKVNATIDIMWCAQKYKIDPLNVYHACFQSL